MKRKIHYKYLGIDIGGTWIKGAVSGEDFFRKDMGGGNLSIKKVKSPLRSDACPAELAKALKELVQEFELQPEGIDGIGISTTGIVDYAGNKVVMTAPHLNVLKEGVWKKELENSFQCKVNLINDADASAIGLAQLGNLRGNQTVGIMPIGTGLGFSVWCNGRRWRPGKSLPLLGSIDTPNGNFNDLASASILAALDTGNNLTKVLLHAKYQREREQYVQNLIKIINSAAIIYNLDVVIICGGLADAVNACDYPLEKILNGFLRELPVRSVKVNVHSEGNRLQLIGALALAKGEAIALKNKVISPYKKIATEIPYKKELQLQDMRTEAIVEMLWQAEQEAGESLKESLSIIGDIADRSVERIQKGGRIIYIGCGTSGRIAAMDAVEIPCTYGFPKDRILTLISGGIADVALEIESDFEEDASAVPEMLLLNIRPEDVVIGISASGTAYYVQSALAFSKDRGALTVMVQSKLPKTKLPFCHNVIPLESGYEVVAGSTRMKAGTATKKILNFLSSTIMIKTGKVVGPYMVDLACVNNKLVERAMDILKNLCDMDGDEAALRLKAADMNLDRAIQTIKNKNDYETTTH